MRENFIGPPKRDFDQLFKLAESELITMRADEVDAALLVAICVNASKGNPFFCCDQSEYRAAMSSLVELGNFSVKDFLSKVTPITGFRKGQIPKFTFVKKNWAMGEQLAYRSQGTALDGIIFSCNWGLAQLPAHLIVDIVEPQFKMQYLTAYLGDLNFQMRELIRLYTRKLRLLPGMDRQCLIDLHQSRRYARSPVEMADRDLDLAERLRHCADPISAGYKV